MSNFCRDVLLPAAAAIGLLAALVVGPARAGDQPTASAMLATTAEESSLTPHEVAALDVLVDPADTYPATPPDSILESGCERVRRIGKFTLTRCD